MSLINNFIVFFLLLQRCIYVQKQPFVDVLQNKCSEKFCIIPGKTPVLESLVNKVAVIGCVFYRKLLVAASACETTKIELFAKIVNREKQSSLVIDVCRRS